MKLMSRQEMPEGTIGDLRRSPGQIFGTLVGTLITHQEGEIHEQAFDHWHERLDSGPVQSLSSSPMTITRAILPHSPCVHLRLIRPGLVV